MKKQKTVSIKAKLLGVIIPVVIAIVVVLVVAAYQISAGTIKKYSQNLLQSSVENQASHRTAHNGIRINKKGIRCNKQYLV